jgi:cell division protein FtsL
VRPSRTPAARPPRPSPPQRHRRARRGSPFAFWILVAVVAGVLILGIASLSALLVQSSFQGDDLRTQLSSLQRQHEVLREQVAAESSPQRIMEWARVRGMQMPERVVILHLPAADEGPA